MTSAFFSNRKIRKAEELKGPRVYSTDLIPTLFDPAKLTDCRIASARALKIKIITKGLVTVNCAHLISPLGVHLLNMHPDIFDGEAILPAFREDKETLADYIVEADFVRAKIDRAQLDEHIAKVGELVKQVMPWQLGNVGDLFKQTLVDGLRNNNSLIVRELTDRIPAAQIADIAKHIEEEVNFAEDRYLQEYLDGLDLNIRQLVKRFSTACYHMVGTSVVQCETGTDLSPLSKFKAADVVLAARDAKVELLSDDAIFLEVFMGFALDTIQASVLPAQIIDSIDFKTAIQLSEALHVQGFQDTYEEIIETLASSISHSDPGEAIDRLDEEAVANKSRELAKAFEDKIVAELPDYKTAIQSAAAGDAYRVGTDIAMHVGLEFAKAIPVVGSVVAFADIIKFGAEASATASEAWSVRDQSRAFTQAQKERNEKIKTAIAALKASPQKKAKLLDAVAALSDVHGLLIQRA
jgi:hypothetical protein